jgi:hypothetical protein
MTIRGRKRTAEEAGPGVPRTFAYHGRLACRKIRSPGLFPMSSTAVICLSLPLMTAHGHIVELLEHLQVLWAEIETKNRYRL